MHVGRAAIELQDPGRDPIEQVPVVGYQHQTAAKRPQSVLEPVDGAQVEMVT